MQVTPNIKTGGGAQDAPPSGGSAAPLRLQVLGVEKSYGAVQALAGVDLELRAGEIMALLGENGAGKSTLVKVLAGIERADAGEIRINGERVELGSSHRSQAAGIAVVQQEYSAVGTMTVAENLVLGRDDAGAVWRPRRLRREATRLLSEVGLEHIDPATRVETLGVAEVQLLEIARVLARDARIVIFDEPTAALAEAEIERVLRVVRRLADQGRSVIYVTHRLPEVISVTDRITVVRNSKALPPIETPGASIDDIIRMMLGRELSAMFPPTADSLGAEAILVDRLLVNGLRSPVSLSVRKGEILGLTGQLGSGAGVVARGIAGLETILGGTIHLHGRPLTLRGRRAGIQAGIGYCSPDRKRDGIFAERSVQDNLSAPWLKSVATPLGWLKPGRERQEAKRSCEDFQIDPRRLKTPVGKLSGGNQQKVALGRWLGVEPTVLVVEAPTRGVDVGARAEIYERLRALCEQGLAVVIASSDASEVLGVCDTVATFYKGTMTAIRPRDEWTPESIAKHTMQAEEVA